MAQLAKVGIVAKTQNVEWAQWLSGTYGNKNYDLTLISHVEPFDLGQLCQARLLLGLPVGQVQRPVQPDQERRAPQDRARLLGEAQSCWPTTPCTPSCTSRSGSPWRTRTSRGLWKDMPVFVNDLGPVLVLR